MMDWFCTATDSEYEDDSSEKKTEPNMKTSTANTKLRSDDDFGFFGDDGEWLS
ncbi:hypothetical protein N9L68_04830 [bacterium]|nr:hypothetical protein [bacterium]